MKSLPDSRGAGGQVVSQEEGIAQRQVRGTQLRAGG